MGTDHGKRKPALGIAVLFCLIGLSPWPGEAFTFLRPRAQGFSGLGGRGGRRDSSIEGVKRPSEYIDMKIKPHVVSIPPHRYTNISLLPKNWDWRNVSGTNFATKDLNQHIPVYCGSCWAHAALSALADRHKILRRAKWPDISYSVQVVLNCARRAGSCFGGDPLGVYMYMRDVGLPEDTCQPYSATDEACLPINICRDCKWVFPAGGPLGCTPVLTYTKHRVSEYGTVSGAANMMAEIYHRGPIACSINSQPLHTYKGGIINICGGIDTDHVVAVSGWGEDEDGVKFWIVRNSWGTYWGEGGWFRIARGRNTLGLERHCVWGVPFDAPPRWSAQQLAPSKSSGDPIASILMG